MFSFCMITLHLQFRQNRARAVIPILPIFCLILLQASLLARIERAATAMLEMEERNKMTFEWQALHRSSRNPVDTGFESRAGEENCLVHRLFRETDHGSAWLGAGAQDCTHCAMLRNVHAERDRRRSGQ